jgi:hypothetical protein
MGNKTHFTMANVNLLSEGSPVAPVVFIIHKGGKNEKGEICVVDVIGGHVGCHWM